MKCICGYEEDRFIPLPYEVPLMQAFFNEGALDRFQLWACPKCGTVKVQVPEKPVPEKEPDSKAKYCRYTIEGIKAECRNCAKCIGD